MKHKALILSSCFILTLTAMNSQAGLVVIGNTSLDFSTLSQGKILNLWLGRIKKLPNGKPPSIIDQAQGTSSRDIFYRKIVKKNESQLKAYWTKKSFTRKGRPPKTVANDKSVIEWVSSHKEGLGYINEESANSSVKILLKID